MNTDLAKQIIDKIKNVKVAVYGDFCLDAYWILNPKGGEVSVETSLRSQAVSRQYYTLGGASNVVANIAALKPAKIKAVGVIGDDVFGKELLRQLKDLDVNTAGLIIQQKDFDTVTFSKRYLEGNEQPRIDFGFFNKRSKQTDKTLIDTIRRTLETFDVLIFNQQVPNSINNPQFIEDANRLFDQFDDKIILLDSRHYANKFRNVWRKTNDVEAAIFSGIKAGPGDIVTLEKAKQFASHLYDNSSKPVFLTRGSRGMIVADSDGTHEIYGIQILKKIDTVGAGDTTISALALSLAAGFKPLDAAHFANYAAAVTVQKLFQTGTASPEEILDACANLDHIYQPELAEDIRKADPMDRSKITECRKEAHQHLTKELLPFWLHRCKDDVNGGFISHFDKDGNDTGEDQKSLIAQTRTVYTMASAHRAGYGNGKCAEFAEYGVDFLIDKMWDNEHGGFYWTVDRKGNVQIDKKILYGLSFAIYSLSEYTLATGDKRGIEYAEKTFDLLQKYAVDTMYGGYFEMFESNWNLCGPGSNGGDRKTLDFHMHFMEAMTNLYECSQDPIHLRKLKETIDLLTKRFLHPEYATGIPQFWADWEIAPQIKFDIVWGWDRFDDGGEKVNALDNTSAGHNVEFAWLLMHATDIMGDAIDNYRDIILKQLDHAVKNGIDYDYGGVYVEGPHAGGVSDKQKEFWQQAEVMIGMLEGYLRFGLEEYWKAYENVHRFLFDKGINHKVGEWWPLLTQQGQPIWTHMSHSWKVNYHSVRAMIQCIKRLDKLTEK